MLDLLGKAAPFAFTPALQIGKLLIESLSRWSYEKDRRDQRSICSMLPLRLTCLIGSRLLIRKVISGIHTFSVFFGSAIVPTLIFTLALSISPGVIQSWR